MPEISRRYDATHLVRPFFCCDGIALAISPLSSHSHREVSPPPRNFARADEIPRYLAPKTRVPLSVRASTHVLKMGEDSRRQAQH